MYNYGLVKFLQAKKLKSDECINAFLKSDNITEFTSKNHNRVNNYIQNNWTRFCSFVDMGIKEGTLQGKAIKLNTYFDKERERKKAVKIEFSNANLTDQQKKILKEIKKNGVGILHSKMMKSGIKPVSKNYECVSKTLQWLPIVNQAIENGISI